MASRNGTLLFVYDVNGAALSGLSLTWNTLYASSSGGSYAAVTPGLEPTITEIGTTGIYEIADSGISADVHYVGRIDCGATAVPRFRDYDLRYEDKQDILDKVYSSGASASAIGVLTNGTYGNSALNTTLGTIAGYVNGGSGSAYALLTNATYGLSQIKTQTGTIATDTGLIKGYTFAGGVSVIAEVQSGTYGLSIIKAQLNDTATDAADAALAATNAESYSLTAKKHLTNKIVTDTTSNQMKVYDDDGTTVIRTFDLFNSSGVATSTNVFRRVPV